MKRVICFIRSHKYKWVWDQQLLPKYKRCIRCKKTINHRYKPELRKGGRQNG